MTGCHGVMDGTKTVSEHNARQVRLSHRSCRTLLPFPKSVSRSAGFCLTDNGDNVFCGSVPRGHAVPLLIDEGALVRSMYAGSVPLIHPISYPVEWRKREATPESLATLIKSSSSGMSQDSALLIIPQCLFALLKGRSTWNNKWHKQVHSTWK